MATTTPAGLAIVRTGVPQTNAGSYLVTATVSDSNYEGSASGSFVIGQATQTQWKMIRRKDVIRLLGRGADKRQFAKEREIRRS